MYDCFALVLLKIGGGCRVMRVGGFIATHGDGAKGQGVSNSLQWWV